MLEGGAAVVEAAVLLAGGADVGGVVTAAVVLDDGKEVDEAGVEVTVLLDGGADVDGGTEEVDPDPDWTKNRCSSASIWAGELGTDPESLQISSDSLQPNPESTPEVAATRFSTTSVNRRKPIGKRI